MRDNSNGLKTWFAAEKMETKAASPAEPLNPDAAALASRKAIKQRPHAFRVAVYLDTISKHFAVTRFYLRFTSPDGLPLRLRFSRM